MANISKEEDARNYEIRRQNGGNWPYSCNDRVLTVEERIAALEAERKANTAKLKLMRKAQGFD